MSLILTVGYPASGKSTFLDIFKNVCGEHLNIIRPSDWYPQNIKEMPAQERGAYQIACWEHALDKSLIACRSDGVIAIDTCGVSPNSLGSIFTVAKSHGHKIYILWVATPRSICESRYDKNIIQKYTSKIISAITYYKTVCDKLIVIKNDTLENWHKQAISIAGLII